MRSLIKRIIPESVSRLARPCFQKLRNFSRLREKRETKQVFDDASEIPNYLQYDMLPLFQKQYPFPPEYGYDPKALEIRGDKRAVEILRLPGAKKANRFLELGCWDGMVSCRLSRAGKSTTAIDSRDAGFDPRASSAGVAFLKMDAACLQFDSESFDFVFSYDAFEHFACPAAVLQEVIRVVRPGGHVYFDFAPLYFSPYGEHAYRSITVPYCQLLWPKQLLNDFCGENGLKPIDFSHVNGWSIREFRNLWHKHARLLRKIRYSESVDLSHLDLIRRFPACFKSKSTNFEDFIVAGISVLFQRCNR